MPSRKFDFKFVFEYLYVLNVFIDSNATVHLSVVSWAYLEIQIRLCIYSNYLCWAYSRDPQENLRNSIKT